MLLGIRWGSLHTKIFVWTFVPAAIVLLLVALVAVQAFSQAAETLVVERDRELTRLYASELATTLDGHVDRLATFAVDHDLFAMTPERVAATLGNAGDALAAFDGGVVVLTSDGRVVAARPATIGDVGSDWSDRTYWRAMLGARAPVFSDVVPDGPGRRDVVVASVPVLGSHGTLSGAIAGLFDIQSGVSGALHEGLVTLPLGQHGRLVLVDGSGRAIFHSTPALIGTEVSANPVVTRVRAGEAGAVRTKDEDGRDVLAGFAPVPDRAWGLIAEESWADLTRGNRRSRELLSGLLVLGIVAPAVVATFGARRITRPLGELIAAAQEVAKGNFGRTLDARTGDEIETLAREFNTMSKELAASYRHLEQRVADRTSELAARTEAEHRRAEQFRVIAEVGRRMTTILPVETLLDEIARHVQEAFGYYHVGIALVEGDEAVYRAGAGAMWAHASPRERSTAFQFDPARLKVGQDGLTGWVAWTGEAAIVPDVTREPHYVHMAGSTTRSELIVPIRAKGRVIGVLDVQSDALDAFDASDAAVIQSLANQAGIAIENARLYEQARQLAVLEERQRVARDLHDSVTQSLYGVSLYADAAARLLAVGEVAQAVEHVGHLRETALTALQEMRLLIFELRPPELEAVGLVAALQARLDAVEGRAGLRSEIHADGVHRAPPAVEEAIYRIAQEALNNALKHARARMVRVTIRQDAEHLELEVSDDGVGFDPSAVADGGGLGLHSMVERAAQLGGRTEVTSAPGEGTRVRVEVPV